MAYLDSLEDTLLQKYKSIGEEINRNYQKAVEGVDDPSEIKSSIIETATVLAQRHAIDDAGKLLLTDLSEQDLVDAVVGEIK